MPKNTRGGKNHKKGKNKPQEEKRAKLELADSDEVYAQVKKRLGGTRLLVTCSDKKERQAIIPGKFRRRKWMNKGDIILCSLDTIGLDDVCTVCYIYTSSEIMALKNQGEIDFEDHSEVNIVDEDRNMIIDDDEFSEDDEVSEDDESSEDDDVPDLDDL